MMRLVVIALAVHLVYVLPGPDSYLLAACAAIVLLFEPRPPKGKSP